jgi:hypothetical protein
MTITHLSHFGLTVIGQTTDNIIFEGPLQDCRRMAFAHGMEVDRYEGRTLAIDGRGAILAPADASNFSCCWFKGSGLLMKTRDAYCLVMPMSIWLNG